MASFEVELASGAELPDAKEEWNAFAPSQANPANTVEYAAFYRCFGLAPVFLVARRGGSRVSQWLISRRRRRFIPLAALSADCGPQIAEEFLPQSDELFAAYVAFVKRRFRPQELRLLKYALVRGVSEPALRRGGFRAIESYVSYVNAIGEDVAMLQGFHESHRKDTRKAMRDGYRHADSVPVAEYLELSRQTYERFGLPGPDPAVVEAIERTLVRSGRALISGIFVEGALCAASVVLYHGHNAFYLHGASSPRKPRGATSFLHFENMRRLRGRGVRHYDFGGAHIGPDADEKSRSLAAFKERFGGSLVHAHGGVYRWP